MRGRQASGRGAALVGSECPESGVRRGRAARGGCGSGGRPAPRRLGLGLRPGAAGCGLQAAPWRPRRPGSAGGQRQAGGQTCRGNQLNKKRLLFKARKFEIFGQEEKRKETLAREGKEKKKKTRANGFETPPPPPRAFLRALRELWAPLPH